MKASIDVHLFINNTRSLTRGEFYAKNEAEIPKVAYDFIMRIRRETGYYGHQSIIERVIVDDVNDITDKVKAIDEAPLEEMNDIFW